MHIINEHFYAMTGSGELYSIRWMLERGHVRTCKQGKGRLGLAYMPTCLCKTTCIQCSSAMGISGYGYYDTSLGCVDYDTPSERRVKTSNARCKMFHEFIVVKESL